MLQFEDEISHPESCCRVGRASTILEWTKINCTILVQRVLDFSSFHMNPTTLYTIVLRAGFTQALLRVSSLTSPADKDSPKCNCFLLRGEKKLCGIRPKDYLVQHPFFHSGPTVEPHTKELKMASSLLSLSSATNFLRMRATSERL